MSLAKSESIQDQLQKTTISFLSEHKNIIKRVVLPFENSKLIYNIILKKDTASNRVKLIDYVTKHNEKNVSKHFKIVFCFVPPQFDESITGETIRLY